MTLLAALNGSEMNDRVTFGEKWIDKGVVGSDRGLTGSNILPSDTHRTAVFGQAVNLLS